MTTAIDPFGATEQQDAEAFFSGGNIAAKFPTINFEVKGNVLGWRMTQQSDMDSREPLWFYNGKSTKESAIPEANGVRARITANPKNRIMQMLIDIQMDEPTFLTWETNQYVEKPLEEDDGIRTLYVKGDMKSSVGNAIKKAGHRVPETGARIKVVRGKSRKTPSGFAAYTFTAEYTPAAKNPHYTAPTAQDIEDDPFA
jgi:hypothetical protein